MSTLMNCFYLQQYDECVNICSDKVFSLSKNTFSYYRFWMESLLENKDIMGVQALTRHCLKMHRFYSGKEKDNYLALSIIGLHHLGKNIWSQRLLSRLKPTTKLHWHAYGLLQKSHVILKKLALKGSFLDLWSYYRHLNPENSHFYSCLYQIQNQYPACPEPYIVAGNLHWQNKNIPTALEYYKTCLSYHPTHLEALLNTSLCYSALGEYTEALNHIENLSLENPDVQIHKMHIEWQKQEARNQSVLDLGQEVLKTQKLKNVYYPLSDIWSESLEDLFEVDSSQGKQCLLITSRKKALDLLSQKNTLIPCPFDLPRARFILGFKEKQVLHIIGISKNMSSVYQNPSSGHEIRISSWKHLSKTLPWNDLEAYPFTNSSGIVDYYDVMGMKTAQILSILSPKDVANG
jgi:tetratricopeptide (TPR) repeat protein